MELLAALFEKYGLLLVFGAVFVEQVGPPLPSGPLLIIAGTLASEGQVSTVAVAVISWGASMLGKVILYIIGGRYGRRAMAAVCRMAVTPDTNITKTDRHFERWGAVLLVVAEFIPGVRTLAPSLAGAEKLSPASFLLYSALGAVLWTAVYLGIGLVFSKEIDRALDLLAQSGRAAIALIAAATAAYFAVKWWRRRTSIKASG